MNKTDRIKELIKLLNHASDAYYNSTTPLISDYDWDKLYDELVKLEQGTGVIYTNSPTQQVGYTVVDKINEVEHNHPMLSLDKTKSSSELIRFAGKKSCVLSVKCDGLTCSLGYKNGKLISAETRGNGVSGCDVLINVLTIANVPHEIPYKEDLIIDGEIVIDWNTFNRINENLPEDKKYKHPRNLVSGSLTLLDSKEASNRNMRFITWRVIKGFSHESMFFDLMEAEKNGFEIVPMLTYSNNSDDKKNIDAMLEKIRDMADEESIPYDGAVMAVDDYKIAEEFFGKLGELAKEECTVLALEANPPIYNTNFLNMTMDAFKLVQKIASSGIKVNYDLGTVIENGEEISEVEEMLPEVNHIHISEPYLAEIHYTELHEKLIEILRESSYDKYVSIEMKNLENIEKVKCSVEHLLEMAGV